MPYQLVPVLNQADETLQLGWTILQEVSLELGEAGGELTFLPQGGALTDEPSVDLGVRLPVSADMTCKGGLTQLILQPFSGIPGSICGVTSPQVMGFSEATRVLASITPHTSMCHPSPQDCIHHVALESSCHQLVLETVVGGNSTLRSQKSRMVI